MKIYALVLRLRQRDRFGCLMLFNAAQRSRVRAAQWGTFHEPASYALSRGDSSSGCVSDLPTLRGCRG